LLFEMWVCFLERHATVCTWMFGVKNTDLLGEGPKILQDIFYFVQIFVIMPSSLLLLL